MADIHVKMVGDGDSPAKCREARRRRIEMRRFAAVAGDSPSRAGSFSPRAERKREAEAAESDPATGSGEKRSRPARDDSPSPPPPPPPSSATPSSPSTSSLPGEATGEPAIASCLAPAPAPVVEPRLAFGSISLSGRAREMEDAVSVQPAFFRPLGGGSTLHFFAVFDGHGGSHVSALCRERMHVILAEELAAAAEEAVEDERWRKAFARSFGRMDELALTACVCGSVGSPPCRCERSGIESDIVGSTAVVAVVSRDRLLVANCGDSRAVLSRGGRAVPLSSDHKPDRSDELARIEAAGGRVIYLNGARVHGILAMSRALGDRYLKPVVISEPEVRIVERTAEDECLIIASDGLWDVLPNDLACDVARRCLAEADPVGGTEDLSTGAAESPAGVQEEQQASESHCSAAATLLARLALGRKSADNISVIVVDLRRG